MNSIKTLCLIFVVGLFLLQGITLIGLVLVYRDLNFVKVVSVGMTEVDVIKTIGEPARVFQMEETFPFSPKAYDISSRNNENKIYLYDGRFFGSMIFVYFDERNEVSCVYWGGT